MELLCKFEERKKIGPHESPVRLDGVNWFTERDAGL